MAGKELAYLGSTPLFLGVETSNWAVSDFQLAAKNAKALGCTSLIVKIADGGIVWGGSVGGWQNILKIIQNSGINAIPYTYCYGNTFNAISAEVNILANAMTYAGIVIADMEQEFNGMVDWANYVANALKPINGLFGVTTWADPNMQNWNNVLSALLPCTNFFLPQVYSNNLATMYHSQFDPYGLPYYPVINLGTDFGGNNIIGIVQNSSSPIIALWEYEPAISSYSPIVKQITGRSKQLQVPQGWSYDQENKILTASNNTQITNGFAQWIINKDWDPGNLPLMAAVAMNPVELGNPSLGAGTVQPFRKTILVWTPKTNVYEMWAGQEYVALYQHINTLIQQIKVLEAQKGDQQTITTISNAVARITAAASEIGTAVNQL